MTKAQRQLLEKFADDDLPLRRAIKAALARIDDLEREAAQRRTVRPVAGRSGRGGDRKGRDDRGEA